MSIHNKQYYLFANWKMYLDYDESNNLASALANKAKDFSEEIKMAIFPGALAFHAATQILHNVNIKTGAQNAHWVDRGGYTGEISMEMYKRAGAAYILVGHSERRHLFYEDNHDVRQKVEAALNAGLTPVICVGETERERAGGQAEEVVEIQLRAALEDIKWPAGRELIVAYEPVWAIGTGNNCEPIDAEKMQARIADWIKALVSDTIPVLLYGGSVRPDVVTKYLILPHINGVLVGGASAKFDSWLEIVQNSATTVTQ